jgi:MFS family permease
MLGCIIMAACLAASAFSSTVFMLMTLMVIWTFGMCFTWPNLEALCADHLPSEHLPRTIGVYNVVWATGSAVAYFSGGALAQWLGWQSIFWAPVLLHLAQIVIVLVVSPHWRALASTPAALGHGPLHESHPDGPLFLKLAWIANPFAYIAINAVIPLIPDLAARLNFSPAAAGVFCSIWFFARMFTFVILALWENWHYRLGWLLSSYLGMMLCFAGILLFDSMWLIVAVQIGFGWCVGVIYYSSLYYSMHVGDTKAEHGGFHEAAIGAGIFGGPAIGAASLLLAPGARQSSVLGVAIVLAAGFSWLLGVRRQRQLKAAGASERT